MSVILLHLINLFKKENNLPVVLHSLIKASGIKTLRCNFRLAMLLPLHYSVKLKLFFFSVKAIVGNIDSDKCFFATFSNLTFLGR